MSALRIIVLDTLAPGAKLTQAIRAAREYQARHPADELGAAVVLEAGPLALRDVYYNARLAGVRIAELRAAGMLTALALAPCDESETLCAGLRPAPA